MSGPQPRFNFITPNFLSKKAGDARLKFYRVSPLPRTTLNLTVRDLFIHAFYCGIVNHNEDNINRRSLVIKKRLLTTLVGLLAFNITSNATIIYVTDYSANTVDEILPGGGESTFATGLNNPFGIAANSSGDLFVADDGTGNIYEYTPGGVRSTFATAPPFVHGLACDSAG